MQNGIAENKETLVQETSSRENESAKPRVHTNAIERVQSIVDRLSESMHRWLHDSGSALTPLEDIPSDLSTPKINKRKTPSTKRDSPRAPSPTRKRPRKKVRGREILMQHFLEVSTKPSLSVRLALAKKTGLTATQVTDWFGNARRRNPVAWTSVEME